MRVNPEHPPYGLGPVRSSIAARQSGAKVVAARERGRVAELNRHASDAAARSAIRAEVLKLAGAGLTEATIAALNGLLEDSIGNEVRELEALKAARRVAVAQPCEPRRACAVDAPSSKGQVG